MPRDASALEWWKDPDLDEVRRRIERRRADERSEALLVTPRGVREVRAIARAPLVRAEAPPMPVLRRDRSLMASRLSVHPDKVAAWAVVLCVVLLLIAIVTSHG